MNALSRLYKIATGAGVAGNREIVSNIIQCIKKVTGKIIRDFSFTTFSYSNIENLDFHVFLC
jgi:hypothetical protein